MGQEGGWEGKGTESGTVVPVERFKLPALR